VPPLSAAALWSAVPSRQLARDCGSAVARVLRAKLVAPGAAPLLPPPYVQPLPHPTHRHGDVYPGGAGESRFPSPAPGAVGAEPPPPPPPPAALPPPPPVTAAAPPPPAAPPVTAAAPPPAATAPAPSSEAAAIDTLNQIIKTLPQGHVALNAPAVAKVGEAQAAEALLSLVKTEDQLKAALPPSGQTVSGALGVAAKMSATLDGGAAFDVTPAGPQDHLISSQQDTEWDWTVTPKLSGQQTLKLTVDAVLTVAGQTGTVRIASLAKTVSVSVTALGWLERFKRMFEDVSWLWGIPPIAAGFGWLWAWVRRRNKPDQTA
jgi:hypothetical protein